MNIFYNDFCLSLVYIPHSNLYYFAPTKLKKVEKLIKKGEPEFPGQIFYVLPEKGEDFLERIYALNTNPKAKDKRIVVTVPFDTQKELDKFLKKYTQRFKEIEAAGGVPVLDQEMLLIFRNGKWDLAKGKIEKGESIAVAAEREVKEETGLTKLRMGPSMQRTYHVYPLEGKKRFRLKTTHWFAMLVSEKEEVKPQLEEGITEVKWFSFEVLEREVPATYPQIETVIREVLQRSMRR